MELLGLRNSSSTGNTSVCMSISISTVSGDSLGPQDLDRKTINSSQIRVDVLRQQTVTKYNLHAYIMLEQNLGRTVTRFGHFLVPFVAESPHLDLALDDTRTKKNER